MGKSRRKKHFTAAKRERKKPAPAPVPAPALERPQVSPVLQPVPPRTVSSPPPAAPQIRYPYIAAELRTIGIIAGIMILILVVLRFVLP